MFDFTSPWDFVFKVVLAAFLGSFIGIERDLHARPTGLRTSMLIAVGTCVFGFLSDHGYADSPGTQDPARIASIVVQGIGFLGAGVLLKGDEKIIGLTTAASIWLTAAIGLAVGAGMEAHAIFVTVFALVAMLILEPLSHRLEKIGNRRMKRKGAKVVHEN